MENAETSGDHDCKQNRRHHHALCLVSRSTSRLASWSINRWKLLATAQLIIDHAANVFHNDVHEATVFYNEKQK